jgi:hypothetical protein
MNKKWIKLEIDIEIETKLSHLPRVSSGTVYHLPHVSSGAVYLQSLESVCNEKNVIKTPLNLLNVARSIFNI